MQVEICQPSAPAPSFSSTPRPSDAVKGDRVHHVTSTVAAHQPPIMFWVLNWSQLLPAVSVGIVYFGISCTSRIRTSGCLSDKDNKHKSKGYDFCLDLSWYVVSTHPHHLNRALIHQSWALDSTRQTHIPPLSLQNKLKSRHHLFSAHTSDLEQEFKTIWKHLLKPQQSSVPIHKQVLFCFGVFFFLGNTILCLSCRHDPSARGLSGSK